MNLNSVADIWKLVLEKLRATLSATTIATWFDETQAAAMQNKTFFLYCPSDFKRNSIESLYMDQIKDALRDIFSSDFEVKFLSRTEFESLETGAEKKPTSLLDSGEFTFDTFVVGDSNKLAYAAARAVADAPAEHYNPLFIYGDSGLGKTHLIYAVAHAIRAKNPTAKIAYVKGDDLTNELVAAIQSGPSKTAEMREKYRQADLLLVDDVQFIAGRPQTQEEFFHTFNTLYESKRQIVLTSDRPPREMSLLDDRLQTRFEWGLLVDVQAPDFETRLAIIKNKAAQWGTVIDDDIANYIAENVTSNVRQLEGTMNKILAYRDLVGKEMDEESAGRAVRDMMKKSNDYAPTAAMIIITRIVGKVVFGFFSFSRLSFRYTCIGEIHEGIIRIGQFEAAILHILVSLSSISNITHASLQRTTIDISSKTAQYYSACTSHRYIVLFSLLLTGYWSSCCLRRFHRLFVSRIIS